jgi:hypothetical protein
MLRFRKVLNQLEVKEVELAEKISLGAIFKTHPL